MAIENGGSPPASPPCHRWWLQAERSLWAQTGPQQQQHPLSLVEDVGHRQGGGDTLPTCGHPKHTTVLNPAEAENQKEFLLPAAPAPSGRDVGTSRSREMPQRSHSPAVYPTAKGTLKSIFSPKTAYVFQHRRREL